MDDGGCLHHICPRAHKRMMLTPGVEPPTFGLRTQVLVCWTVLCQKCQSSTKFGASRPFPRAVLRLAAPWHTGSGSRG